jgi:D-glycero-alpha-D-manno-heptose-7-phosphate kinase
MIISKTPFRISFIGGGTDLPYFADHYPGSVISTTINKYMYISIKKKFDKNILVSYSKTEEVENSKDLSHPLAREILKYFKISQSFEVSSMADIPAKGSGLGSSSAYTVGLINAISTFKELYFSKKKICDLAIDIEINRLKEQVGMQDQAATCYGGLRRYFFNKNHKVTQRNLIVKKKIVKNFENSLLFFYIGNKTKSNKVFIKKKSNLQSIKKRVSLSKKFEELTNNFQYELNLNNINSLGEIIKESWVLKKSISEKTSNSLIDNYIDIGIKNGAYGGKILGAGGGGFLMFVCDKERKGFLIKKLSKLKLVNFNFEEEGTKIIYK